jgi:hypothetical protein
MKWMGKYHKNSQDTRAGRCAQQTGVAHDPVDAIRLVLGFVVNLCVLDDARKGKAYWPDFWTFFCQYVA